MFFWCPNLVDILGKWNFYSRYYFWYFSTGFGFGFHRNFLVWVRFLSKPKKWFRWINKQYQTKPIFKMTWKARPKSFHKLKNQGCLHENWDYRTTLVLGSLPYPMTKNRNLQINKMRFSLRTSEATMTSRPESQFIDLLKKIAIIAKIARIVKIAIYAVPSVNTVYQNRA